MSIPTHAASIVDQLLAGMEGWDNAMAIRCWLKQEGNAEHTLKAVVGLLAEMGDTRATRDAVDMLQSAINGTALGHFNVAEMTRTEAWDFVTPSVDEWELV